MRFRAGLAVATGLDFFHYADIRDASRTVDFRGEKANFWDQRSYAPDYLSVIADYYRRQPRKFVATYRGTHPAFMHDRITRHQGSLDPDSAAWRTKLTPRERRTLLLTRLERTFARLPVLGMLRKNRIVASHRGEVGAAAHHVD